MISSAGQEGYATTDKEDLLLVFDEDEKAITTLTAQPTR